MNIALLAPASHPVREPFATSVQMHIHLLARELQARGHRVLLVAPEGSDPAFPLLAYPPEATQAASAATDEAEEFWREQAAYQYALVKLAERHDLDLLHIHAAHPLPVAMARLLHMPCVVTLHHAPKGAFLAGVRSERLTGSRAKYVALSASHARLWRPQVRQCSVIPGAIALESFPYCAAATRHTAFWYGRLMRTRGAHHAIEAAHRAGMNIRLAGISPRRRYVEKEILPRLQEGDAYLGYLDTEALAAELGQAAVYVHTPRAQEPFALGAARALACGTPVASFHSGAATELITSDTGRLAPAGDVDSLAAAIEMARDLSRPACRQRAEDYVDHRRMAAQYEALYRRAVADGQAPHPTHYFEHIAA